MQLTFTHVSCKFKQFFFNTKCVSEQRDKAGTALRFTSKESRESCVVEKMCRKEQWKIGKTLGRTGNIVSGPRREKLASGITS